MSESVCVCWCLHVSVCMRYLLLCHLVGERTGAICLLACPSQKPADNAKTMLFEIIGEQACFYCWLQFWSELIYFYHEITVSTIFVRSERVIHNSTLHLISIAWMSVCVWVTWCRPPLCLGRVWRGNWFHGYICQSGCSTCSTAFAAASDERGEWWQDSAGLHGWIYETHTNHSK